MEKKQSLMHNLNMTGGKNSSLAKYSVIFLLVVLFGLGSGYMISLFFPNIIVEDAQPSLSSVSGIEKGKIFGSNDTTTFKDTTEGVLNKGGIEGEGQYHLVRPGGDSQNVYLISSTVDLSLFVDKKIKVWGQTQQAQRAGWLMDVGRVEVLE